MDAEWKRSLRQQVDEFMVSLPFGSVATDSTATEAVATRLHEAEISRGVMQRKLEEWADLAASLQDMVRVQQQQIMELQQQASARKQDGSGTSIEGQMKRAMAELQKQLEEQGQDVNIGRLEQQRLRKALIDAELELQQAAVTTDQLHTRLWEVEALAQELRTENAELRQLLQSVQLDAASSQQRVLKDQEEASQLQQQLAACHADAQQQHAAAALAIKALQEAKERLGRQNDHLGRLGADKLQAQQQVQALQEELDGQRQLCAAAEQRHERLQAEVQSLEAEKQQALRDLGQAWADAELMQHPSILQEAQPSNAAAVDEPGINQVTARVDGEADLAAHDDEHLNSIDIIKSQHAAEVDFLEQQLVACRGHFQEQVDAVHQEATHRLEAAAAELRALRQQHAGELGELQHAHSLQLAAARSSSQQAAASAEEGAEQLRQAEEMKAKLASEHVSMLQEIAARHDSELQMVQEEVLRLTSALAAAEQDHRHATQLAETIAGQPQRAGPADGEEHESVSAGSDGAGCSGEVASAKAAFAARMQVLEEDLATKDEQVALLQASLEEMSESHGMAQASLLECQDMLNELQNFSESEKRKVADLEKQLQEQVENVDAAHQTEANLREDLEAGHQLVQNLKRREADLERQCSNYEHALEQLTIDQEKLQLDLRAAQGRLSAHTEASSQAQGRVLSFSKQLALLEKAKAVAEEEVAALREQLEDRRAEQAAQLEQLAVEVASEARRRAEAENTVEEYFNANTAAQALAQEQNETLLAQLHAREQAIKRLAAQLGIPATDTDGYLAGADGRYMYTTPRLRQTDTGRIRPRYDFEVNDGDTASEAQYRAPPDTNLSPTLAARPSGTAGGGIRITRKVFKQLHFNSLYGDENDPQAGAQAGGSEEHEEWCEVQLDMSATAEEAPHGELPAAANSTATAQSPPDCGKPDAVPPPADKSLHGVSHGAKDIQKRMLAEATNVARQLGAD